MNSNRDLTTTPQLVDIASASLRTGVIVIGGVPGLPDDYGYGDALVHAWEPAVSSHDICDLLGAAGPLSLDDIAGGLGVPARQAAMIARWMLDHGLLEQDEWDRFMLRIDCPSGE